MSIRALIFTTILVASCKGKQTKPEPPSTGTVASEVSANGSSAQAGPASGSSAPTQCPAGAAVDNGACVPAVTAEKVDAVANSASKLDELGKLLEKAESLAGPVELLGGLRQTDAWKAFAKINSNAKVVDDLVGSLDAGVKELRSLKSVLSTSSSQLTDLRGQLGALMQSPNVAKPLAELKQQVESKLQAAIGPLESQLGKVQQQLIGPALSKVSEVGDLVVGACAMAKVSGGGTSLKDICDKAKTVFASANTFLVDIKDKPAQWFLTVNGSLKTQLTGLLTAEANKLLDNAQTQVNQLLGTPTAGSGSGGSGSADSAGSATP